jgi:hypothetical protein
MIEPSSQDQLLALIDRVQEQGIEIASLRRLVYAMGSHLLGGPPGTQALHIWHQDQINPPPSEESPSLRGGSPEPTASEVTSNPTSAATVSGSSPTASPPVSPAAASTPSSPPPATGALSTEAALAK